jgi:hypothetical protein
LLEARENTNVHARSESSGEKKQRAADHALLAKGFDLADEYFFVESWFEVGDKVDAVLTGNRAARAKREALIIEKVLEPRREWWTQAAVAWRAEVDKMRKDYKTPSPRPTAGGAGFLGAHDART